MPAIDLPISVFWPGPRLTDAQCLAAYRRYYTLRDEYGERANVYASTLAMVNDPTAFAGVVQAHEDLGRPVPESQWTYTIPSQADANVGDWALYSGTIPEIDPFNMSLIYARIFISGRVCAAVAQMMVATQTLDAYNLGTGGPGGRIR